MTRNRKRRAAALLLYEHRNEPLLPPPLFRRRLIRHAMYAFGVIGVSWLIGIVGYRLTGHYSWLDCLYNAAMILGGMGPVSGDASVTSTGAKWFASFYALYSGIVLLSSVSILIAPVAHRILHRFHLAEDAAKD